MIWAVQWAPVCHVDVLHAGYRVSESVCAAVHEIARTGKGLLDPVRRDVFCLRARGGFALVSFDATTRTVHVRRILPNEPRRRIVALL